MEEIGREAADVFFKRFFLKIFRPRSGRFVVVEVLPKTLKKTLVLVGVITSPISRPARAWVRIQRVLVRGPQRHGRAPRCRSVHGAITVPVGIREMSEYWQSVSIPRSPVLCRYCDAPPINPYPRRTPPLVDRWGNNKGGGSSNYLIRNTDQKNIDGVKRGSLGYGLIKLHYQSCILEHMGKEKILRTTLYLQPDITVYRLSTTCVNSL